MAVVYCALCLVEHFGNGRYCDECEVALRAAEPDAKTRAYIDGQLIDRFKPLADDRILLRLDELIEVALLAARLGPQDRSAVREPVVRVARANGAVATRAALMELSATALAAAASLPAGPELERVQGHV